MYKLAYASGFDIKAIFSSLEKSVNLLLDEGYQPQGSVSIAEVGGRYIVTQAMVK